MHGGTRVHDVVHGGGMMSYIYSFQLGVFWATIGIRGMVFPCPGVPTSQQYINYSYFRIAKRGMSN